MSDTISFKLDYIINKKSDIKHNSLRMCLSVVSQNGPKNIQL